MIHGKESWFQITLDIGMLSALQVCSVFYLAKNTNGTLGGFFYHLSSVIYAFLTFCCTFCENFWNTRKNIPFFKLIHSGYSRSYFNLFLSYDVACDARKIQTFTYIKTVVIVQKIDLIQKYWVNFPNFQIKTFRWSFLSPKNLNLKT